MPMRGASGAERNRAARRILPITSRPAEKRTYGRHAGSPAGGYNVVPCMYFTHTFTVRANRFGRRLLRHFARHHTPATPPITRHTPPHPTTPPAPHAAHTPTTRYPTYLPYRTTPPPPTGRLRFTRPFAVGTPRLRDDPACGRWDGLRLRGWATQFWYPRWRWRCHTLPPPGLFTRCISRTVCWYSAGCR